MGIDLIKDMAEAVRATAKQNEKTSAYDTPATVVRIQGKTAWVHIPGGVEETPVSLTINAKAGDTVRIRVGGGSAWIVGNATAPPTDDTKAKAALDKAAAASGVATNFVTDTKDGIFVHPKDNTADGVSITDAIEIIKGGLSYIRAYVEGGIAKVRVGRIDKGHSVIDSDGMRIYGGNGTKLLANIGYGEGNAQTGTLYAPYFTFGERGTGQIGNLSVVEGDSCVASGFASHAEGIMSQATNYVAHAEGGSIASGQAAHAEGLDNLASGNYSHAEGGGMYGNTASGYAAHAEGYDNTASGNASHVGGIGNTASYEAQTVIGKYAPTPSSDDLFMVGNGTGGLGTNTKSYAMRLKDSGRVEFAGAVGSGLTWDSTADMVTAMSGLSLDKPYNFQAGSTWVSAAGASGSSAFGTICKTSTTSWHMFFMAGGSVYKSIYDNSAGTYSTTAIG